MNGRAALVVVSLALVQLAARLVSAEIPTAVLARRDDLVPDFRAESWRTTLITAPDAPWTLMVGGSTLNAGIDPAFLSRPAVQMSWVNGSATTTAAGVEWTLDRLGAEHMPDRVTWFVSAAGLSQDKFVSDCEDTSFVALASPGLREAIACEVEATPASVTRSLAALDPWWAEREMNRLAVAALIRPPTGPAPWSRTYVGTKPALARRNLDSWIERDVLVGAPPDRAARAIAWLDALCERRGLPLDFVILPEPAATRAAYAPGRHADLVDALARYGAVTDAWEWVADDGFFDQAHLNVDGARALTQRLDATWTAPGGGAPR